MNRALLDLQLLDSAIQDATREKARLDDGTKARATLAASETQLAQTRDARRDGCGHARARRGRFDDDRNQNRAPRKNAS